MACKRNIRRGFWIPYDVPSRLFRDRLWKEFGYLRTIILTCGPSFSRIPTGLKKSNLQRLVEIGWLKHEKGQWVQIPLDTIFEFVYGTQKHWHGIELLEKDVRAVLYKLDQDYQTRNHKIPEAPENQRTETCGGDEKTRQHHRESLHLGGICHTINMKRMRICKGYSSKLRKLCQANGLAAFEERIKPTKWDTAAEGRAGGADGHLFDTDNGAWCQYTSLYVPIVPAQMRMHVGKVTKGGWRLRQKRDQRLVSNFVTGGAYAM